MLQITDVNFDGTTFLIEDNNTSTCKINAADFFQWLAESTKCIHIPDTNQIVIPQIIGRWDNDRQQSYNITNTGEIYTYQGYYNYLTGDEFDELIKSYLDSVDPVWVATKQRKSSGLSNKDFFGYMAEAEQYDQDRQSAAAYNDRLFDAWND
jgi:hypothetical protein